MAVRRLEADSRDDRVGAAAGVRTIADLRGAAMPWDDLVGNAVALAAALGIRTLDASIRSGLSLRYRDDPLRGHRGVTSRVWPAARRRSTRASPIAVAGVRTPAVSGSLSPSSARQSALSPSMTAVAA